MPGQIICIYLAVSKAGEGLAAWKRDDEIQRSITLVVVKQMDWREDRQMRYFESKTGSTWSQLGIRWMEGL